MTTRRWRLALLVLVLLVAACGSPQATAIVPLSTSIPATPGLAALAPTSTFATGTPTAIFVTPTGTLVVPITATVTAGDNLGRWSSAGMMGKARLAHSASLLADGRVLIVGGAATRGGDGSLGKAEIYDPATNSWSDTTDLSQARSNHTATVLADGRVVIIGGRVPGGDAQSWQATGDAEVFDGASNSWQSLAPAPLGLSQHTAVLLPDGTILVAGGLTGDQSGGQSTAATEVYDPATNSWTTVGSLTKARHGHTMTLLPDGRVLVTGGESRAADGTTELTSSAEIYDPESRTWSPTGSLSKARQAHTATLLPDGRVLIVGGETSLTRGGGPILVSAMSVTATAPASSVELYDPQTRTWAPVADLPGERAFHSATRLPDGQVLVVGGYGPNDQPVGSALRYDLATNRWTSIAAPTPRAEHSATLLLDGSVLVVGGRDGSAPLASAERYFPQGQIPAFASPSPSPSPTVEPSPSPSPSAAPVPTATSTPTRAPAPTATRTPTQVPVVVPTSPPTATPTPTRAPAATATATNTPVPMATFTPTATRVPPTDTPTPTPTNTPVPPTATPTDTPRPTATHTPTATRVPPTATHTPTNTPVPPTATFTPTNTRVPPTNTPTNTPITTGAASGIISFCVYGVCEPQPDATVTLGSFSTASGSGGAYSITKIPAGTYTIVATFQGYRASSSIMIVGGRTTSVNLQIQGPVLR